jgi:hypothetical protein
MMTITHDQAEKYTEAVAAAVTAFSQTMDVDGQTGRNALFGCLLAEFLSANGAATRAELDKLVTYIEVRAGDAAALDNGAPSVEVPE